MKRAEQRKIAMMSVYMMYLHDRFKINTVEPYFEDKKIDIHRLDLTIFLLDTYLNNKSSIEEKLGNLKKDYPIHRLSFIDKSIMDIAITEMFYGNTPTEIVINEAVEMSKEYSDEDAFKFINSALGALYRSQNA